jgi:hypothetical protein
MASVSAFVGEEREGDGRERRSARRGPRVRAAAAAVRLVSLRLSKSPSREVSASQARRFAFCVRGACVLLHVQPRRGRRQCSRRAGASSSSRWREDDAAVAGCYIS